MSYKPHESFIKRLHELDRKLGAFFNGERVVITYDRAVGPPVCIMTVETEDGEFRIPDERDIIALKKSDNNVVSLDERMAKTAHYMEEVRAKQRRIALGEIDGRTADDKYQLARAYATSYSGASGKVGRHVRRMAHKPRGKVF